MGLAGQWHSTPLYYARDRSRPNQWGRCIPRVSGDYKDVGFILPVVEFGGVERVALNIARALRQQGYRPHLFVTDSRDCQWNKEWQTTFESVTFLADEHFTSWGGACSNFLGTDVPDWSRWGDQRNAVAMLAWLDVAVNFHGGAISGLMGRLRKFGVKTAISLHLNDHSPTGRPVGNPIWVLPSNMLMICFCRALTRWLIGVMPWVCPMTKSSPS